MILDTQYLGQLAVQDPDARELAEEIESTGSPRRIPSAVVAELFYGLGKMTDDETVARRSGTLRGKHAASDELKNLDGADSVVAAHGLLLDEPVVSNDTDFLDVEGLEVVTY
ncbi:PIN domain-containing protein [Halobellus salinisoli]|uniref:PIN domain-containing protein n=1 Tax=Halobellus salinisoli TaxID=3108500 RepID=UPI00300AA64B